MRRPRLAGLTGLLSIFLAMFFFKTMVLFTAERLTWYAAAFFLMAILLAIRKG